jgi:hypothetical protein
MNAQSSEEVGPLVWAPPRVIDPDNKAEMERFARLHDEAWERVRDRNPDRVGTPAWEIIAEQFRLFTDPSYRRRPEEPTGLGAVVEDDAERLWTRYDTKGDPQPWWCDDADSEVPLERRSAWAGIAAIRIHSGGVER